MDCRHSTETTCVYSFHVGKVEQIGYQVSDDAFHAIERLARQDPSPLIKSEPLLLRKGEPVNARSVVTGEGKWGMAGLWIGSVG